MLGVCSDMQDNGSFLNTIAVEYNDQPLPPGLVVMTLPEVTWMIFSCRGPMSDAIQQTWKRIMTEILPASTYRYAGSPDMEVYSQGDGNRADYYSEIWIPIVENKPVIIRIRQPLFLAIRLGELCLWHATVFAIHAATGGCSDLL